MVNSAMLNNKESGQKQLTDLVAKLISQAFKLPNTLALSFAYALTLLFVSAQISFFFYLKQLKDTRAINIAEEGKKSGDFVLHTLEYGWKGGVKLIPKFIHRKVETDELAESQPAPKLAPAPGVDSPTAGGPAEVGGVSPDFSLPPVADSPLDPLFGLNIGPLFFALTLSMLLTLGFVLVLRFVRTKKKIVVK